MCGRYVMGPDGVMIENPGFNDHGSSMPAPFRRIWPAIKAEPFNGDVRPGSFVSVAMDLEGHLRSAILVVHAGLVQGPKDARKMTTFNARIETVATSRTFRAAWGAGRRVLMPMLGYYEWQPIPDTKNRQRFYISPPAGEDFAERV